MNNILWTKQILDEFIRAGCLSEDEEKIITAKAHGWTRAKMSMCFNMSISNVDRIIRKCMQKYDCCQKNSDILPERKRKLKKLNQKQKGTQ